MINAVALIGVVHVTQRVCHHRASRRQNQRARSFPFGIDIGTGPAGAMLTALEEWP